MSPGYEMTLSRVHSGHKLPKYLIFQFLPAILTSNQCTGPLHDYQSP